MGLISLIFGSKRASIGGITIDATMRETHTKSAICTENPVESGSTITDHVNLKPAQLEIDGIITDTPVTFSIIDSVTGLVQTAMSFLGKKSRSIEAYDKLINLQKSRIPFKVVTGLKVYDNMILENFTVDRDAKIGKAIHLSASLKQIIYAVAKTTGGALASGGAPADSMKDMASSTADKGSQAAGKASESMLGAGLATGAAGLFSIFAALG